jgi:Fic family protein
MLCDTILVITKETPWINFSIDLKKMGAQFWMLLGEARSKCDHLANVPMPRAYADEQHIVSLSRGVHATTAIEGNTMSVGDVEAFVRVPHSPPSTLSYREREVENVLKAYNEVLQQVATNDLTKLTPSLIKHFNRQVLSGLELGPEVEPGKLRQHSVTVGPYRAPEWNHCERMLDQLCDWLNGPSFSGIDAMRIPVAIIRASVAHLYLAWIHPFGDGNGRTARLCEYLVLITSGIPTSAAHLISSHCNDTRDEYYRQLQSASESGGDITRFLNYCADGFVSGLTTQLSWVYERQFRLTWQEHVRANVTGRDPDVRERRTLIAEALFNKGAVPKKRIGYLSTRLAELYAVCGDKTVSRDLRELVNIGLLRESDGGYIADTNALLSLLPLAVPAT